MNWKNWNANTSKTCSTLKTGRKKAEAARNEKLTRLDEEKSKIALELASVNEKLDNLGQEKANKLNALKEAWAHLQKPTL